LEDRLESLTAVHGENFVNEKVKEIKRSANFMKSTVLQQRMSAE
jgi:hypothetical protein